ncbi:MAG TPA: hypothetical protein VFS05_05300 [Gemmatimonadaceae bacterium]|nr:hypothetical protein [Gemmatimonadaceae bacterium]
MKLRSTLWLVAVLFLLVNLAGGWIAAVNGELVHTCVHAGLVLLSVPFVLRLAPKRAAV